MRTQQKCLFFILFMILIYGIGFTGSIVINRPNGGERWEIGKNEAITWNSIGLVNLVKITLWKDDVLVGLIANNQPANGSYDWSVGTYVGGTAPIGTGYKIKIKEKSTTTSDISNRSFEIISPPRAILVEAQIVRNSSGSTISTHWRTIGITGNVKVDIVKVTGSVLTIKNSIRHNHPGLQWRTPLDIDLGHYFIRVSQGDVFGVSRNFEIRRDDITPQNANLRDLEITNIYTQNGMLYASIRSNINNYRGNVEFMVTSPVKRFTKYLDLKRGVIKNKSICQLHHFYGARSLACMIDSNLRIAETNERNNTKSMTFNGKNLSISSRLKKLSRLYGKGGKDYKLEFEFDLDSHNSNFRNVDVKITIMKRSDPSKFSDHTINIDQTYGNRLYTKNMKMYFEKSSRIVFSGRAFTNLFELKKGSLYRMVLIVDPENRIDEINERDNSSTFTFKVN